MADVKLVLKRPITELFFDVEENSLEAAGYVNVVRCENCECKTEHFDSEGNLSLVCEYWDGVKVEFDDYCSHGVTRRE